MLRKISQDPNSVIVMTWNIYIGANVDPIVNATDSEQVPLLVWNAINQVLSNNFPERAKAIADEIGYCMPHLIGLQEVSSLEFSHPIGTISRKDYLEILLDTLQDRNLEYKPVASVANIDIRMPYLISDPPYTAFVHLVDYDVILARSDVETANKTEMQYDAMHTTPTVTIPRGFVAVDAKIGRKTYRFVNTHLEPDSLRVQKAQALQLISELEDETLPIILVGDLNTPAPDGSVYQTFLESGYVDAWTRNQVKPRIEGLTSGHDSDLRNTSVNLEKRIDFIMVRSNVRANGKHKIGPVFSWVLGDERKDMCKLAPDDWVWPSDHAGVVALLWIPVLGHSK